MKKKLLLLTVLSCLPVLAFATTQQQANQLVSQLQQDIGAPTVSAFAQQESAMPETVPNAVRKLEIEMDQQKITGLRGENLKFLKKAEADGQITEQQAHPYAKWTKEQAHQVPKGNLDIHKTLPVQNDVQQSVNRAYPIPNAQTTLKKLQVDAQAIRQMAGTWQALASDADTYQNLMAYANATWAGEGPQVSVAYGGVVQCHNPRWDAVSSRFEIPGLNLVGDGEVENYTIQAISTHFQTELANYIDALMSSHEHPHLLHELEERKGPMLASENMLIGLLSTLSSQVQAATGRHSVLQQLPVHYQIGAGPVTTVPSPNPPPGPYSAGPNDGAPIGFAVYPDLAYQVASTETVNGKSETVWNTYYRQMPDIDVCPTGSGGVSLSDTGVRQAAARAVADDPGLQAPLQAILDTHSSYQAQPYISQSMGDLRPFGTSQQFVRVLGYDLWKIGGYMAPVTGPIEQFNQQVQWVMREIDARQK